MVYNQSDEFMLLPKKKGKSKSPGEEFDWSDFETEALEGLKNGDSFRDF